MHMCVCCVLYECVSAWVYICVCTCMYLCIYVPCECMSMYGHGYVLIYLCECMSMWCPLVFMCTGVCVCVC
jgi:hypothetical protein